MNYYHMTSLSNLRSISKKGLIPGSGANSKLIGDEKIKTFFSEGFEGVIALYVDFQIVYDKVRTRQVYPERFDSLCSSKEKRSFNRVFKI